MALGDLHGLVNIYTSGGVVNQFQELFKSAYEFFEDMRTTHGYCERVALYYGNSGTGTDYHDGANPFGSNAWFVYRFPPTANRSWSYYVLVQWADVSSENFGAGGGAPAAIGGLTSGFDAGIGWQFAVAFDSNGADANPWNGTSNFDGADTKGTPVWTAPGGGEVHVWPRENAPGGAHDTNRESLLTWWNSSSTIDREHHLITDGDHLLWVADFDVNDFWHMSYWGSYSAINTYDPEPKAPGVLTRHNSNPTDARQGELSGGAGGGVMHPDGSQVVAFRYEIPRGENIFEGASTGGLGDAVMTAGESGHPIGQFGVWIDDTEVGATGERGFAGRIDSRRMGYLYDQTPREVAPSSGPPYHSLVVGVVTANNDMTLVAWGASVLPRNTATRVGESF